MSNYIEIDPTQLIEAVAEELKKVEEIKAPEWASFVKTGNHKERVPDRQDWWHVRNAAILRRVGVRGPIGVSKLRTHFGGKKNRGMKPERFKPGSGNIIRKSLQQLEKAGLIEKSDKDVHKGRILTGKGMSILNKQALIISKKSKKELDQKKVEANKPAPKPVQKEQPKPEVKTVPNAEPLKKVEQTLEKQSFSASQKPKVSVKPIPKELPKKEVPKQIPKQEVKELPKKAHEEPSSSVSPKSTNE